MTLHEEITEEEKSHYVLIKDLSKLFKSQTNHKTKFFCPHCLVKSYNTIEELETHINYMQ
jgi:hypothetical protein